MKLNKDNKLIFVLLFPMLILLLWVGYVSWLTYVGKTIKLPGSGYDPRDLLSGKYILLKIDWEKADCKQFYDNICPQEEFEKVYRYYAPEDETQTMEKSINTDSPEITMEFTYKRGKMPILKEIYFDNKVWKDYQKADK